MPDTPPTPLASPAYQPLSRRRFLTGSTAALATLGAGGLLAACGSATPSTTTTSSPATSVATARPRRGGTLRAALSGGSSSDTLDAQQGINNVDFARILQLYNPLVGYTPDVVPELALAEEITPNANATVWTVRTKQGVLFHNGKELTADDVLFSINRIVRNNYPGASMLVGLKINEAKKLDTYTVSLPFSAPYASLVEAMAGYEYYLNIVPVGYDPKHPIGTGPFMYKSFTPGLQSTFVRNPHYWESPGPYFDQVVITDYPDETTQINALEGGSADVVNLLSASASTSVKSAGYGVLVSPAGGFTPFTMRVDVAPFNDVNVRQALRYIAGRHEMRDVVFDGDGLLGNDIFSIYDPEYDHSIPQRHEDFAHAKFLLKKAGQEHLTVELVTADIAQGTVSAAQVLAQQASQAGVTINLNKVTVTEFYGTNYLKWPFAQDYWYYSAYLPQVGQAFLPNSPFNETHFDDPHYTALYNEAVGTLDAAKQADIAHEMQQIDWSQGGYIIPYFPPVIDGYSPRVKGLLPSETGLSLGGYAFKRLWFA
jgi:peptide/nickel transport system substrate-binding protein